MRYNLNALSIRQYLHLLLIISTIQQSRVDNIILLILLNSLWCFVQQPSLKFHLILAFCTKTV